MVKLTGGGISGNKTVQARAGGKVEPKAKAINPASVAQQGMATQFRKEPLVQGKGYNPAPVGPTGIANARQGHDGPGPGGGGRTIYKSGSQSPTPEARPLPEGKNTLAEYGRDIPGRK
jgi:hypothetical protein